MADRIETVQPGERLILHSDEPTNPIHITVVKVGRWRRWADVICYARIEGGWTKRQRLPLPEGTERVGFCWWVPDDEMPGADRG